MTLPTPKLWIARDAHTGSVHLFDKNPTRENGVFFADTNMNEGIYLGKRPRLGFTLKRGHKIKVVINFWKVSGK